jgi:hypothetical protein
MDGWFAAHATAIMMLVVLIIFNFAIVKLAQFSLKGVDVPRALRAKSVRLDGQPSDEPSYSRIAGMIGAVVLACFVWALGNVILYKAFYAPKDIDIIVSATKSYFLGASALFAPYAFNQLKEVFKS